MKPAVALQRFVFRRLTPARSFIISFLLVILAGTVLLLMPVSASGRSLSLVDALFTSTSAVCVTGLTVVDVGRDLSLSGQVVTLLLFQIGGLGIITFSLVLFGLMGRSLSFRGRELLQSSFLHTPRRDFFRILRFVVAGTFVIEGTGALLLFFRFLADFPPGKAFFQAVYHAVSAFNNCGYTLLPNNLTGYRDDWTVNLVVVALIVLGGMGFIVIYEVLNRWRGRQKRLSLHARVVLLTTAALVVGGALLFYLFETGNVLKSVGGPCSSARCRGRSWGAPSPSSSPRPSRCWSSPRCCCWPPDHRRPTSRPAATCLSSTSSKRCRPSARWGCR
jgi:trk system potassium uptake protein TrkH